MNSEVLIIGGGVIGLSIARELHLRGVRQITLLEKAVCGGESSWAAAGMLGTQAEADIKDVFFDLCCESRDLFPAFAGSLQNETGIDVELDRSGTLSLAFTDEDAAALYKRYQWQRDAGLSVELLSAEEIIKAEPYVSVLVQTGLFFENDWQVENRRLLAALRRFADLNGISIIENAETMHLLMNQGRVIGAETQKDTFLAETTVLATGAWSSLIKIGDAVPSFRVAPVRGQMVCLRPEERLFEYVIYSRRGYIVPRSDGRVLAGSTSEDVGFEKGVTDEATAGLQEMAGEISPFLGGLPVVDRWSGLRPFPADGLPVIGEIAGIDRLFIATGHYRNGILLAPLTAKVVADALTGGMLDERIAEFNPNRFQTAATAFGNK